MNMNTTIKRRVWIIDDDTIVGNILVDHLRGSLGFDPYYFSCAKDAYKMLRHVKPDIILLDWMMPNHDGMQFIKTLKKKEKTSTIPIFMITGKTSITAFESACHRGIDGYITKPIDYVRLSSRLNYFFDNLDILQKDHQELCMTKLK